MGRFSAAVNTIYDEVDSVSETAKSGDPVSDGGASAPKSDQVIAGVDDWTKDRGREVAEGPAMAKKMAEAKRPAAEWNKAAADCYASLNEHRPEFAENPSDEMRSEFLKGVANSQEYAEMRAYTVGDPDACEVGTHALMEEYAKVCVQCNEIDKKAKAPKLAGAKSKPAPGQLSKELTVAGGAARAAAAASGAVKEAHEVAAALGCGGENGGKLDRQRIAKITGKLRKSPSLKKMLEWAGRFMRVAMSAQKIKTVHGVDDTVGVELGDEIGRILPAELMRLMDPDLEAELLARMLRKEAFQLERRGVDTAGRGPIFVAVDESGSMSGDKIETAKGLALAMACVAREQKRWCVLIGFSDRGSGNVLALPPGRDKAEDLLAWLEHFFCGGTDLDVPLRDVQGFYADAVNAGMGSGKTDYICITDGQVGCDAELRDEFLRFKSDKKMKVVTIAIDTEPGELEAVSDRILRVPGKIDIDTVSAVTGGV